jgi:hypothetical protein
MRDRRSLFSLLFCLEEGEAGISMFDQAAQARTVLSSSIPSFPENLRSASKFE